MVSIRLPFDERKSSESERRNCPAVTKVSLKSKFHWSCSLRLHHTWPVINVYVMRSYGYTSWQECSGCYIMTIVTAVVSDMAVIKTFHNVFGFKWWIRMEIISCIAVKNMLNIARWSGVNWKIRLNGETWVTLISSFLFSFLYFSVCLCCASFFNRGLEIPPRGWPSG